MNFVMNALPAAGLNMAADRWLVRRARAGAEPAFDALWQRHLEAVSVTLAVADAGETLGRVRALQWQLLQAGVTPCISVRSHFVLVAQSVVCDETPTGPEGVSEVAGCETQLMAEAATTALGAAFLALSPQQQELLWYRDVDALSHAECALFTGIGESALDSKIAAARTLLRRTWVSKLLGGGGALPDECRSFTKHIGQHVQGVLPLRSYSAALQHAGTCTRCLVLAGSYERVHEYLPDVLLTPLFGHAATAYRQLTAARPEGQTPADRTTP
ncbi:RNA polymerase sigma factor [Leucobacter sp. HY1908]